MYFNKAISLACKMLASRRPFRVQVKPTTFPMMLSYNGNCLLRFEMTTLIELTVYIRVLRNIKVTDSNFTIWHNTIIIRKIV